jgi:hypothetical protein
MPHSLHSVWTYGGFLGIRCKGCDHRAVLDRERCPQIRNSNMTRLRDLTFKCAGCGVTGKGADLWAMALPMDHEQAKRFLSGYDDITQAEV